MKYTTKYKLKKPDYTDKADVADLNDNADSIDSRLFEAIDGVRKALEQITAEVGTEATSRKAKDDSLTNQIASMSISGIGTTVNSYEIVNARTGASGLGSKTYRSLGEAIRTQVENLLTLIGEAQTSADYLANGMMETVALEDSEGDIMRTAGGEVIELYKPMRVADHLDTLEDRHKRDVEMLRSQAKSRDEAMQEQIEDNADAEADKIEALTETINDLAISVRFIIAKLAVNDPITTTDGQTITTSAGQALTAHTITR